MSKDNEQTVWKWAWVLVASLAGSIVSLALQHRIPSNLMSPAFFGEAIGGLIVLYAVAMIFAIFVKGWPGVLVGCVVVAALVALMNYR